METKAEALIAEAAGRWNPYYLAYAKATGAKDPEVAFNRDGGNHKFFCWNSEMWAVTKRRLGLPESELFPHLFAEHMNTLAAHVDRHGGAK